MNIPNDLITTTIQQHPELYDTIQTQWGCPDMDTTLERWLISAKHQWPKIVKSELINLYILHKDHYTFQTTEPIQ